MTDAMDPPAIGTSDADRDRAKWGTWGSDGGQTTGGTALRYHNGILKTTHLAGRRTWLNSASAVLYYADAATPGLDSEALPTSQPANAADGISFQTVDYNPASGTQEHEYFVLRNSNPYAVDISGWQITGAINFTFRGGAVIPAGSGTTQHIGDLFVAKNPFLFRQRAVSPKGNEFCYVEGPYSGQLSARGETLELRDAAGTLLKTTAWSPAPLATQLQLRITELNYAPTEPTDAEKATLPGVVEGDFEYLELMNIGATPLALGGAYFDKGITFTFPAGYVLAAGARCLLVSNHAAFVLRYGSGLDSLIAGQYDGQLDNNGETIQLNDAVGESILEFRYESTWFPPSDEGGRSLVVRDATAPWQNYDLPTHWALSGNAGGSPGTADSDYANVYEGWRWDHFTSLEIPTVASPNLPAAMMEDPDGDRLRNIGEYAFGRAPKSPDHNTILSASVVSDAGTDYLAVTFRRRHKALDLTYNVEASNDLVNWTPVSTQIGAVQDLGNGIEQITVRDTQPYLSTNERWIRVRAVKL
jgi:Lamin Tail Domain